MTPDDATALAPTPAAPAHAKPPAREPGLRRPTLEDAVGFESFRAYDRMLNASLARFTGGLSPMALGLAFADWALHLSASPGKRTELGVKAVTKAARFWSHAQLSLVEGNPPCCIEPLPGDPRFTDPEWQRMPFRFFSQAFLLTQQWWHNATHDVAGVSAHHEDVMSFVARQLLDVWSPSNLPWTNPAVLSRTIETGGLNLVEGWRNAVEDMMREASGQPPLGADDFLPGENVAVTPGKVVLRNSLIELIQYEPQTAKVHAEPVLIVPAWIMKYYVLDLSPENSLVRYLVERGHTVFCISWRNVTAQDRDVSLEDYRRIGVMAALEAIAAIVPDQPVHAVGYCLGGTLLAIAAAAMARARTERLASVTLIAAQTDFTEPGELGLFIDPSQVDFLESMMWDRGYLDAGQMAGAFQLLRSRDLIWSQMIRDYLMGERRPMIDLIAWNADATRLPYRMHKDYLNELFLSNDLAANRYIVDDYPVSLHNIRVPIFAIGTERDHVAPWQSVYKIHNLADTAITFVLASGGHNAGIVSPPSRTDRHYRIMHHTVDSIHLGPAEWMVAAETRSGSWWPVWADWLAALSPSDKVKPSAPGAPAQGYPPLCEAPGTYVFQR